MRTKATVDQSLVDIVCDRLIGALRTRQYPYEANDMPLPQRHVPMEVRDNPLHHAQFLFYACHYMRGTIQSELVFQVLARIWNTDRFIFDPHRLASMEREEAIPILTRSLSEIGYKTTEVTAFWYDNSAKLSREEDGDPRRLLLGVETPSDAYGRIVNAKKSKIWKSWTPDRVRSTGGGYLGFQEKMTSMLAYFLVDAKLIPAVPLSPAVDFHLIRVMLASGAITLLEGHTCARYEDLNWLVISALSSYMRRKRVNAVELGDALWVLSGQLCRLSPTNRTQRSKGTNVRVDRQSLPEIVEPDWDNPNTITRWMKSCGSCPIRDLCRFRVPSGTYYEKGAFTQKERPHPPNGNPVYARFPNIYGEVHTSPSMRRRNSSLQSSRVNSSVGDQMSLIP